MLFQGEIGPMGSFLSLIFIPDAIPFSDRSSAARFVGPVGLLMHPVFWNSFARDHLGDPIGDRFFIYL